MSEKLNIAGALTAVREKTPLVHCITNYVTVNDVANILLASGGSPIMADCIEEVRDIQSICGGLDVNIGTLNERTIPAMFKATEAANEFAHPCLLDPVGAGASALRTNTAIDLMLKNKFTVIRGNISEIKCLADGSAAAHGVDADPADAVDGNDPASIQRAVTMARHLAEQTGSVVVITGATDLVVSKDNAAAISNGHPLMSTITGTGCQLSGMLTGYLVANPEDPFTACVAAVCLMGLAGERAAAAFVPGVTGNSSYRNMIIDSIFNITAEELEEGAKYVLV